MARIQSIVPTTGRREQGARKQRQETPRTRHQRPQKWREGPPRRLLNTRTALVAAALVGLGVLVVRGVRMPSRSMENTLLAGEHALVEKVTLGIPIPYTSFRFPALRSPIVGDVILFRHPQDAERTYVKRCIAVSGQTVEMRDKAVYVDGDRLADPTHSKYVDARIVPAWRAGRDNLSSRLVPPGFLFVLGDNRDNSRDSRHWGFLPIENVIGRVVRVYWSSSLSPPPSGRNPGGFGRLSNWILSLPERVRWSRIGAEVR